jgi:hypothetical protein
MVHILEIKTNSGWNETFPIKVDCTPTTEIIFESIRGRGDGARENS